MNKEIAFDNLAKEITHGIYVSNLAYLIGEELGLEEPILHELAVAGLLHDIGKLKLTSYLDSEDDNNKSAVRQMRYVRLHSQHSYEILKERGYSDFVIDAVHFHHENYDGTGYPMNLSEDSIPLGARILRVCDVFVALTSDRTYRKAFDVKQTIELMIDEIRHFDMKIFLAFQRVLSRIDVDEDIKKNMTIEFTGNITEIASELSGNIDNMDEITEE